MGHVEYPVLTNLLSVVMAMLPF